MNSLHIVHRTRYTYHRPVEFGPHRLVLRPREGHDLRVEALQLTISPAHEIGWTHDLFGNSIANVVFLERSDELNVVSDLIVRRTESPLPPRLTENANAWPVAYDLLETVIASAYLKLVYPQDEPAIRAWLANVPWPANLTAESALATLNRHIFETLKYTRRDEKGVLSPAQTLAGMAGSCRDLATLLLESSRLLGVAGRFASGYLECAAAFDGEATTHAWMEAYLPGYGWRGYDPSAGELTTGRCIATGVSNHPRGVMPISGLFYGERDSFRSLDVSVSMETLQKFE